MTEGQIPAGWYDDGRGQLRWYDGTAWTEHVQPVPAPSAPPAQAQPQAQAAQPAQPEAQAAQAAPAAPAAPAAQAAPAAAAAAAPASQSSIITPVPADETWEQPAAATPIYRKPWFLVLVGVVVLAVIGGIFALAGGGDDDSGSTGTPTSAATGGTTGGTTGGAAGGAAGGASFGANAATVAAKANCNVTATIPATAPAGTAGQPSSKVTCTLGSANYTVVTWASAADQNAEGALANAFTQPVTAGTKYYATGEGWTAFDTTFSQAAAQAFATPAGGTAKGVVVVLASPTAAP